jgi:ketosteroid isomerase-like protein
MSAAENKLLVQHIFAELANGNPRPFVDGTSDDFRWIVTGTTPWSKTYEGKQAVFTELFPALRSKMADRMRTIPDRLIAEGDHVVVEAHGQNTTRSGKPYNQRYCFVIRVVDGKLRELTEYMDSALAMAVLSDGA